MLESSLEKLSQFQTLQFEMADMTKLYAAKTAMYVTTKAVQLYGGCGYTKVYPVDRIMRDAKITEIYEGTS